MELNSSWECPGLKVLDFRPHYPCFNVTDTRSCEEEWPCEVREYWIRLHPFVDVTRAFLSYGSIGIIVTGVILNLLSFYILVWSGLAKKGSGTYLVALAICDSGNLLTNYAPGVWRGWSEEFNQYFMDNEWLCRFHGVFVELFQTISAWIVVAFTVERCLVVWYPMKMNSLRHNQKNRARIVVASLTTVLSLFCLSKLFLSGFENDSVFGYKPCNSRRFIWQGMAYVRVAFQTWIPTIIVFVFNCLMFWKLRKIKSNRQRLTKYRRKTGENAEKKHSSFIKKPTNPMLLAVSLTYLILVFPLGAVQTVELYWNVHRLTPVANFGTERDEYVYWKTTKLLIKYIRSFFFGTYQINFAINFFLYFAAGLEFRLYLISRVKRVIFFIQRYFCCTLKEELNQELKEMKMEDNTLEYTISNSTSMAGTVKGSHSLKSQYGNGNGLQNKAYSVDPTDPIDQKLEIIYNTINLDQSKQPNLKMNSFKQNSQTKFVPIATRKPSFPSPEVKEEFEKIYLKQKKCKSEAYEIQSKASSNSITSLPLPSMNIQGIPSTQDIQDYSSHPVNRDTDEEIDDEVFYESHEMSQNDLEEPKNIDISSFPKSLA